MECGCKGNWRVECRMSMHRRHGMHSAATSTNTALQWVTLADNRLAARHATDASYWQLVSERDDFPVLRVRNVSSCEDYIDLPTMHLLRLENVSAYSVSPQPIISLTPSPNIVVYPESNEGDCRDEADSYCIPYNPWNSLKPLW